MTPEIEQATTWTAVIGAEPVVILLPRVRGVHIEPSSGALVSADAWTTAVTEHGARPMRDLEFAADPAPDWLITLSADMTTAGTTTARITGPAGLGEIYTGELVADPDWRRQVADRHEASLVLITGTAERMTPQAALEMMEAERAVWVRATLVFVFG